MHDRHERRSGGGQILDLSHLKSPPCETDTPHDGSCKRLASDLWSAYLRRVRRFRDDVIRSLANETNPRFWWALGIWWVVSSGATVALMDPTGSPSEAARLPFYVIAASLIPVLLSTFVFERKLAVRTAARRTARIAAAVDRLPDGDATAEELRRWVEQARHLQRARIAYSALMPAAGITGEVIALSVVATGASTTFCFASVMVGLGMAALGAILETADAFARLADPQNPDLLRSP